MISIEERVADLRRRMTDAKNQVTYWSGRKLLAPTPVERARCGGLAAGWETTRLAVQAQLNREIAPK